MRGIEARYEKGEVHFKEQLAGEELQIGYSVLSRKLAPKNSSING